MKGWNLRKIAIGRLGVDPVQKKKLIVIIIIVF